MVKCSMSSPPWKRRVKSLKRQHSIPSYTWVRVTSPERAAKDAIKTMPSWREMHVSHEVRPSVSPLFIHVSVKTSNVWKSIRLDGIHFPAVKTFSFTSLFSNESIRLLFDREMIKPSCTSRRTLQRDARPRRIVWTEGTLLSWYRDLIVRETVSTNR